MVTALQRRPLPSCKMLGGDLGGRKTVAVVGEALIADARKLLLSVKRIAGRTRKRR